MKLLCVPGALDRLDQVPALPPGFDGYRIDVRWGNPLKDNAQQEIKRVAAFIKAHPGAFILPCVGYGMLETPRRFPTRPDELTYAGQFSKELVNLGLLDQEWFNEPNAKGAKGFWDDGSPEALVKADAKIMALSPSTRLWGPSLAIDGYRDPKGWTERILAAGGAQFLHRWSFHPYADPQSGWSPEANSYRRLKELDDWGVPKSLLKANTEQGWDRAHLPKSPVGFSAPRLTGFEKRDYRTAMVSSGYYLRAVDVVPSRGVIHDAVLWADEPTLAYVGIDDSTGRIELLDKGSRFFRVAGIPAVQKGVWRGGQAYALDGGTIHWDESRMVSYPVVKDFSAIHAAEDQADLIRRTFEADERAGVECTAVYCDKGHGGYDLFENGKPFAQSFQNVDPGLPT